MFLLSVNVTRVFGSAEQGCEDKPAAQQAVVPLEDAACPCLGWG